MVFFLETVQQVEYQIGAFILTIETEIVRDGIRTQFLNRQGLLRVRAVGFSMETTRNVYGKSTNQVFYGQ